MKTILDTEQLHRTLKRITHEIIEAYPSLEDVVLCGILSKGAIIADEIKTLIQSFTNQHIQSIHLDIKPYRDDEKKEGYPILLDIAVKNKNIIIIDDVLFTGRSVRAAIDGIMLSGRPKSIKLAVLVDRGHRELPIRPDFIGKNIPTSMQEKVVFRKDVFDVIIDTMEQLEQKLND
jgi:pyrimidine operon attenuation protein/uracil phosphoribosyltransferase